MKTINENIFDFQRQGQRLIVSLRNMNRISIIHSNDIENELIRLIENGENSIFIDLSNIEFIDSAGFQALISVCIDSKLKNVEFVIWNANKEICELFELVKLSSIFEFRYSSDTNYNQLRKVS